MRCIPAIVSFILAFVGQLHAAEVTLEQMVQDPIYGDNCLKARILLRGNIEAGDADRLTKAIDMLDDLARTKNSQCYLNDSSGDRVAYVELESNGGLYVEGWKIAKLLKEKSVSSYVGESSHCYSACAVAFLGGSIPGADGATLRRRIIHPTAKLGFHAPFPMLDDTSYDAATVRDFFLTAFAVSSSFMKEAKSLGITPEVAQLLLQPTPDQFYEIDTVGRALLTGVTVSAASYSFSVYGEGKESLAASDILNLCYNNQIIRSSGDTSDLASFLEYRSKESPMIVRKLEGTPQDNSMPLMDIIIVPVADAGEGETESCIATVVTSGGDFPVRKGWLEYSCAGFALGEQVIADKIQKNGFRDIDFGPDGTCNATSKIALLPWYMKLIDIPIAYQGN